MASCRQPSHRRVSERVQWTTFSAATHRAADARGSCDRDCRQPRCRRARAVVGRGTRRRRRTSSGFLAWATPWPRNSKDGYDHPRRSCSRTSPTWKGVRPRRSRRCARRPRRFAACVRDRTRACTSSQLAGADGRGGLFVRDGAIGAVLADQFVIHHNTNSQPFQWAATADSILEKLHRRLSRISGTGH